MLENLIFVPGFFQGRLFLERVSVENFWSKFLFQNLNCNQITVTINNNRDYWKLVFPWKGRGEVENASKNPKIPPISSDIMEKSGGSLNKNFVFFSVK